MTPSRCISSTGCRQTGLIDDPSGPLYCSCDYGHWLDAEDAARNRADKMLAENPYSTVHATIDTAIAERDQLASEATAIFRKLEQFPRYDPVSVSLRTPAQIEEYALLLAQRDKVGKRLTVLNAQLRLFAEGVAVSPDSTRLTDVGHWLIEVNRVLSRGKRGDPIVVTDVERVMIRRLGLYVTKMAKVVDRDLEWRGLV